MNQDDTKARLLEAAGEEFAEKGFDGATVRSICQKAGANLAAVNYHFGDKSQLYIQAVVEAHRCGTVPLPADAFEHLSPADQLRKYIRHFLSNVLAINRPGSWQNTLMLREMLSPTEAADILVDEAIRPRFLRLSGILGRICPGADRRRLDALCMSVVGQCLQYKMARMITEKIIGPGRFEDLYDLDYLSAHIGDFTLAALGLAAPLDGSGRPAGTDGDEGGEGS
ncbi:CerR family C-terminal domain-containing protein [Tundrisphaera sp. TA3]|uniref:CerR family C-terminal domain-containing protein n=1 Tax=Tundrisphaera sp. TA3 TaxID=3435775 RepID=UPI003EBCC896